MPEDEYCQALLTTIGRSRGGPEIKLNEGYFQRELSCFTSSIINKLE
jgi:hypothetical protein